MVDYRIKILETTELLHQSLKFIFTSSANSIKKMEIVRAY